jgi:hypothetical protein
MLAPNTSTEFRKCLAVVRIFLKIFQNILRKEGKAGEKD